MMTNFEAKVVSSGMDSLVVGFSIIEYRNPEFFSDLEAAKAKAGEKLFNSKGCNINLFGKEFIVRPSGIKGYEFVLENADASICIARKAESGRVYPEILVTFRASFLWAAGYAKAFSEVQAWLGSWAVINGDKVSRCDLCVDIQMDMPRVDLPVEVITRARNKEELFLPCEHFVGGKRDVGYEIGSHSLMGRIYDKTLEIKVRHKEWFQTIWSANGWNGESKVIRVEFQAARDFLKEMSVDDFGSLCDRLADMWRYYTFDWLTIRVPAADSHRHRWQITDWWQSVQGGFTLFGEAYGVLRNKQTKVNYEHLMKQVRGCLISAMALNAVQQGVEYGVFKAKADLDDMLASPDLKPDVIKRKAAVNTFATPSKTHLVDAVIKSGGELESVQDKEH